MGFRDVNLRKLPEARQLGSGSVSYFLSSFYPPVCTEVRDSGTRCAGHPAGCGVLWAPPRAALGGIEGHSLCPAWPAPHPNSAVNSEIPPPASPAHPPTPHPPPRVPGFRPLSPLAAAAVPTLTSGSAQCSASALPVLRHLWGPSVVDPFPGEPTGAPQRVQALPGEVEERHLRRWVWNLPGDGAFGPDPGCALVYENGTPVIVDLWGDSPFSCHCLGYLG